MESGKWKVESGKSISRKLESGKSISRKLESGKWKVESGSGSGKW